MIEVVADPDAMLASAQPVEAAAFELRRAASMLARAAAERPATLPMPALATLPVAALAYADRLDALAARRRRAAAAYADAEVAAFEVVRAAGEHTAWLLGRVLPLVVASSGPWGGALAVGPVLAAGGLLAAAPGPLANSPAVASLVRAGVEFVDDLGAAALFGVSVPPSLRGDERALLDRAYDAAVATGGVSSGGLVVTAHERASAGAAAAATRRPPTVADVVAAVPEADDGGPQVAVTTYTRPDGAVVHLAAVTGTSNQGVGTSTQPFDHLGNVAAYGRNEGESISAVLLALESAGVRPGDEVVFAGYSQGALVVQAIVESGRYEVPAFVSVGGPITTDRLPAGVDVLELQHPADPVVALQGWRSPADDGSDVVVVDPYAGGRHEHTTGAFDSHELGLYRDSAALAASTPGSGAEAMRARLATVFADAVPGDRRLVTVARAEPRFGAG